MPRRGKKSIAPTKENEENEEGQLSRASSISNMDDTQPDSDSERNGESNLALILKELRELRKDFGQQLSGIKEDISKIGKRVEEAEERINGAETRIQSSEDVLTELVKLQMQTEAKLTDLEGRS
ncbi:Coiled-coil domain containing protein 54 [Dissostichus eleginoides]|uniref:Coiled-coil domain containing protein 54 n=1 Tax=Dissostichus eleginoides TaxID=100907 RepID=A0AAD9F3H1_DISEL|nr:Coiled-coil domain containing protein 54 [Dissostichus eleginoides]